MEYHSVAWALLQLQGYLSTLGPPNHQHWSHFYPTKSQQKPILPTWHSKITNLQMQKANAIFQLGLDGPKVIDVPWKHSFAAGGTRKRRPTGQQKTWSFGGFCGSLGFCQRTGVAIEACMIAMKVTLFLSQRRSTKKSCQWNKAQTKNLRSNSIWLNTGLPDACSKRELGLATYSLYL